MISIEDVRSAFPELTPLSLIASSGQKHVLQAGESGNLVLKIIKSSQSSADRAAREAEAVGRLQSKYIPRLIEVGERKIGGVKSIYFVEKFIEGSTYRKILINGRQPLADVISISEALLSACCDFEMASLVHRDIKPENIIIQEDMSVWILDFGIVRILDLDSVTKTSDKFGPFTPGYGAPEQIRNEKSSIDSRADLFSVGVMMHEALLGYNSFLAEKRDSISIIRHMLELDLERLDEKITGSNKLSDFISSMTGRFPSRRPESAKNALEWFREIIK